jgi:hypoxanthine phosphoribosyltransferase
MSLRRILSRGQIRRRVKELAANIRADYSGQRPVFVCVLKGAFVFLADLVRQAGLPLEVDFIAASSYGTTRQERRSAAQGYCHDPAPRTRLRVLPLRSE